jgi:2-succinyl-6-hydroxy-2,4-cyclohexadiene-1-carboxylate synthase
VLRDEGLTTFVDRWQAQPLFATQARVHPEKLAVRRARRLRHDPEQLARSLEEMGLAAMPDYRPEFPADRVGLIAGADDAKYVEILHQLGAPFATIPGSGHDPTLEQPAALGAAIARLVRLIGADW